MGLLLDVRAHLFDSDAAACRAAAAISSVGSSVGIWGCLAFRASELHHARLRSRSCS